MCLDWVRPLDALDGRFGRLDGWIGTVGVAVMGTLILGSSCIALQHHHTCISWQPFSIVASSSHVVVVVVVVVALQRIVVPRRLISRACLSYMHSHPSSCFVILVLYSSILVAQIPRVFRECMHPHSSRLADPAGRW